MKPNPLLLKPRVRKYEREIIRRTLAKYPNSTLAAAMLGITVSTLNRKKGSK